MSKWVDAAYRLGTNAFARDKHDNVYTGETLMLALLLHVKKDKRTKKNEDTIGRLLDKGEHF